MIAEEGSNEVGKTEAAGARTRHALPLLASQKVPHMGKRVQGTLVELASKYIECVKPTTATNV